MEEVNFQLMFLQEAKEIVQELEEALLKLEKHPDDVAQTNEIFRHMHSLKGSGAMFGFQNLSNFTHHLENLFDIVRKNPSCINRQLFDVTFRSIDHIKRLLTNNDNDQKALKGVKLVHEVETIMKSLRPAEVLIQPVPEKPDFPSGSSGDGSPVLKTWYICFKPDEDILINGTNPMFLMDELMGLGEGKVFAHTGKVPGIRQIHPKLCYVYWEIILVTRATLNEVKDIFLFVEDSGSLHISVISEENLLDHPTVKSYLNSLNPLTGDIDPAVIQKLTTDQQNEQPHILSTIRVASEKLDTLMNLVSEFVTAQARLDLLAQTSGIPELITISEVYHKLSRQLRENTFDICLIPIHNLVTRYTRLVRDLSKETGKQVEFITTGTETELDKTIIERLNDPLLHIIRNCIDHGIESPEERRKSGKPETGQILFRSYYSGTFVYIIVQDDGKGIDPEIIRKVAVARGMIREDEDPGHKALLDLLFLPGFTTAKNVTTISGRGVGMDVIRQKMEELRGHVDIDSVKGKGTTITLQIPLTLSIIDGFLLMVGDTAYILPMASVDVIYELEPGKTEQAYLNTITLNGKQYPFFDLRDEFGVGTKIREHACIITVKYEEKMVGLVVDRIIGSHQAVLKPIGKYLKHQDIFSGASILGDGSVALVLDPNKIIAKFANHMERTR